MKNKILNTLFFLTTCLVSCGGGEVSSSSEEISSSPKVYEKINHNPNANLHHITSNRGNPKLKSLGEQKILVIPVVIKGFEDLATKEVKDQINTAFFGDTEDTGFESVASYYNKSSYGRLTLKGKVTDFFSPNLTAEEILSYSNPNYGEYGLFNLSNLAIDWYKENHDDIKDYDNNQDGFVDGVWLIYLAPNYSNAIGKVPSDLMWAFSFSNFDNLGKGDVNSPLAMSYSWASYDFMYDGYGNDVIDAHVYIHETGHMLGLEDYYCSSGANISPMGRVDMMDDDLGDHSPYSKFALGWCEPYIIDEAGTITLNSFTETGDCLLFKTNNYNNTPFDEYIMIDYVTPTGLNEKDYIEGYRNKYGYQEVGVRFTYINSLAIDENFNFCDDLDKMTGVKYNNSPYGNMEGIINPDTGMYYILTTLMPKDCGYANHGLVKNDFVADSSHLFKKNDEFNLKRGSQYRHLMQSTTNKYVKKDAGFFMYNVVIEEITETNCTIRIENVN